MHCLAMFIVKLPKDDFLLTAWLRGSAGTRRAFESLVTSASSRAGFDLGRPLFLGSTCMLLECVHFSVLTSFLLLKRVGVEISSSFHLIHMHAVDDRMTKHAAAVVIVQASGYAWVATNGHAACVHSVTNSCATHSPRHQTRGARLPRSKSAVQCSVLRFASSSRFTRLAHVEAVIHRHKTERTSSVHFIPADQKVQSDLWIEKTKRLLLFSWRAEKPLFVEGFSLSLQLLPAFLSVGVRLDHQFIMPTKTDPPQFMGTSERMGEKDMTSIFTNNIPTTIGKLFIFLFREVP